MTPKEMTNLDKKEFLYSIASSEGRVIAAETIGIAMPMLVDITNAEFVAGMGADIIILNLFDVDEPRILGLPDCDRGETIRMVKKLAGRPVGINLEPVENPTGTADDIWAMSPGRKATLENAEKAVAMGADFIVLTGNPGNGVSNEAISASLERISKKLGDRITLVAGKMHASGILSESGERIITKSDIASFMENGADVILLPAPGTVPGITTEYVRGLVSYVHENGKLAMTSIGTSQEGADEDTIRRIAIECKMTGTDIHHIGDSGYMGMALPENIFAYSVATRGVRHTYRRMAMSLER